MQSDELQRLVDELAERLQKSVAIDDANMLFLVASRHFGDEDPGRVRAILNRGIDPAGADYLLGHGIRDSPSSPVIIPTSSEHGFEARRCFPIRWGDDLLGFLWLIDTDGDRDDLAALDYARKSAIVLYERMLRAQQENLLSEGLVRELVSADARVAARAHDELVEQGKLTLGESVRVAAIEFRDDCRQMTGKQVREHVETLRQMPPFHRFPVASVGPHVVAIVKVSSPPSTAAARAATPPKSQRESREEEQFLARVKLATQTTPISAVGIGNSVASHEAALSYRQATLALRAATNLETLGPVISWQELGVIGPLLQLGHDALENFAVSSSLRNLMQQDRRGLLTATLEAFLDAAGDMRATASQLHIHRSTLQYRLDKIEQFTSCDLANGQDRLTLHLGLKVFRILSTQK